MSGVEVVLAVLESNGYERLPKPLTVAGTEFEFEAAASGTNKSQDLVIVAAGGLAPRRLLRLVSVLARSLDVVNSKRPVTVILVGGLASTEKTELERHARVLILENTDPTMDEVKQAAAVLLPLDLPSLSVAGRDPISEVIEILGSNATDDHLRLVESATSGAARVEMTLRDYVNAAIREEVSGDD